MGFAVAKFITLHHKLTIDKIFGLVIIISEGVRDFVKKRNSQRTFGFNKGGLRISMVMSKPIPRLNRFC